MTASQMPIDQPVGAPAPAAEAPAAEAPAAEAPAPTVDAPEDRKRRRRRAILLIFLIGLLAGLILLIIWYLLFRQPLPLPLPVIPDGQVPAYSTSIYGASNPVGVAVTPAGDRLYVTDTGGDRLVYIYDGGGNVVGSMAPPAETGTDHVPVYVAIDPLTEEVYVTDRPTGSIYIYDRDGRYQRTYQPATPIVGWQPLAIAFDAAGALYVSDLSGTSPRILMLDRAGELVRTVGESEAMAFPNGIALDEAGNLYVTDSNNGRLLVFDAQGQVIGRIGRGAGEGNLGLPRGATIDGQGRLFVVDSSGQGVLAYRVLAEGDARPGYIGFFGGHGVADGEFAFPMGAASDDRGRLYIADTANGRVQVWSY